MLNLLKFEYRRLFRRPSIYICLGIIAVPVMYMFLMIANSYFDPDTPTKMSMFAIMRQMIGVANLTTLCVIFTSIFVCEDKARGTIKTIYSLGYPRIKLFFAKFISSATAAALMYAVVLLFGLVCSVLFADNEMNSAAVEEYGFYGTAKVPDILTYVIQQFFIIMGVHAFYYLIAELVQKTGVSIVLGIFGPGIISSAFGLMTAVLCSVAYENTEVANAISNAYATFLMYWLPSTISSISGILGAFNSLDYGVSIIVNIGYVLLFGGLALLVTSKKQIK